MEVFIEYYMNALVFEGKPGEIPARSRRCVPDEFIDHRSCREGVNEDEGSQKTLKRRICATPARVRVGLSCILCGKRTVFSGFCSRRIYMTGAGEPHTGVRLIFVFSGARSALRVSV